MGLLDQEIKESELRGWNLVRDFRERLQSAIDANGRMHQRERPKGGPKRLLHEEDYFSGMLFALLNPVIESMRGLSACSKFEKVQEQVTSRKVSLGSFSEAQHVFNPELLQGVLGELAKDKNISWGDSRLQKYEDVIQLIDGSLIPALPRMQWALWQNDNNKAAKLHLKFNVLRQAPSDAFVTHGNACERQALKKLVKKGEVIVGDRYYGSKYGFLNELKAVGASFVIRVRNNPKVILQKELPLTDTDREAGVVWQAMVKLGSQWEGDPIRLVCVEVDGKRLVLATDLEIEAELIALIYKYRWQVELFFKWIKSTLGCRHLLAESLSGVTIQIYCALIIALLLQAFTGKKVNKRAMEAIQFYMSGMISLDELNKALKIQK